ncbi:hypothetical protein P7K49_015435 [Saguinus oedipus]|uniref:Uncharacterized protein n=1 Tax=Saguinus oedipus TaxID=9490 RepID=A0ABQ9V9T8_SAGOE|nr:hypothetical protein P7K49_015435 [Saguinus oedipus]
MAPPNTREPGVLSATSATRSDGEMVLPGFLDADSFVKESPVSSGQPMPPRRIRAPTRRTCTLRGWVRPACQLKST